jgi:hypothetical protein
LRASFSRQKVAQNEELSPLHAYRRYHFAADALELKWRRRWTGGPSIAKKCSTPWNWAWTFYE